VTCGDLRRDGAVGESKKSARMGTTQWGGARGKKGEENYTVLLGRRNNVGMGSKGEISKDWRGRNNPRGIAKPKN